MDGPYSGPFNIGNPTEFTMLELAQVVKDVVNPKAEITYKENTADDPTRRKPDITKARPCLDACLCIKLSCTLLGQATYARKLPCSMILTGCDFALHGESWRFATQSGRLSPVIPDTISHCLWCAILCNDQCIRSSTCRACAGTGRGTVSAFVCC